MPEPKHYFFVGRRSGGRKKQPKPDTKIARVMRLSKRVQGCTVDDIVQELGVSKSAANSLIGDIKRYYRIASFGPIEQVIALCRRKEGCTTADIVSELGVSAAAAGQLIHAIRTRRKHLKLKRAYVWRIEN